LDYNPAWEMYGGVPEPTIVTGAGPQANRETCRLQHRSYDAVPCWYPVASAGYSANRSGYSLPV